MKEQETREGQTGSSKGESGLSSEGCREAPPSLAVSLHYTVVLCKEGMNTAVVKG